MKTWEMIKELTKSPKKKFIRKGDPLEITADGLKYLRWASGHDYINLDHDWEEVKEPVDFMTAFRAWVDEGKDVTCVYGETERVQVFRGANPNGTIGVGLIERGKWYIED